MIERPALAAALLLGIAAVIAGLGAVCLDMARKEAKQRAWGECARLGPIR